MIALAVLALAAGVPGPALRPVLDRPYRLTIEEERGFGGRLDHFTVERQLVFRRDSGGLVAEVTLLGVTQTMGGSAGRRFEAALAPLRGRVIRFHLGEDGRLIAIDDETALSAVITETLRIAGSRRDGPASGLPPQVSHEQIASMLTPVIAVADVGRSAATHPVSVPSVSSAVVAPLTGTESVAVGPDALLHIVVHASSSADDRAVSLDRERSVDRVAGLIAREDEVQTIRIGDAVQVTRKQIRLTPPV